MTKPDEWAVVAGATGAIGSQIVEQLLDRGLGVVAVARSAAGLQELGADRANVVLRPADISSDESVVVVRDAIPGTVRMVVNSAAAPMAGTIGDVAPSAVVGAIEVKVNGTLRLVRAADDHLTVDSRIVAIGGNLGYDPIPEAATAGVGNAALANAIRQLSRALGPRGVTCHVVAPGPVWTDRLRALLRDAAQSRGVSEDVVVGEFRERSPIGHLVEIGEVVWAVDLLLDPRARSLAGGTLLLDAGQRTAIP